MNPEKLFEAIGGADSELIARADKYISPTEAYSREQKPPNRSHPFLPNQKYPPEQCPMGILLALLL